jgi:hypothetical protein
LDDSAARLPFDYVVTQDDGRRLTVAEFFSLPLARRIRLILDRRLEFFRGPEKIDIHVGLQALMGARRS